MMSEALRALRVACREHPRSSIVEAVFVGLGKEVLDVGERRDLAALVAAWLLDEEHEAVEFPPLNDDVVAAVRRELLRRIH